MSAQLKFSLIQFVNGIVQMSEGDLRICKRGKLLIEALNKESVTDLQPQTDNYGEILGVLVRIEDLLKQKLP